MGKTCIAVNCNSSTRVKTAEKLIFHSFPINPNSFKQWIDAGQYKRQPTKHSMLCYKHFTDESYIHCRHPNIAKNYLRKDAVPSIFPSADIQKNQTGLQIVEEIGIEEDPVENHTEKGFTISAEEELVSPSDANVICDWDSETYESSTSEESESSIIVEEEIMDEEVEQTSFDNFCRICSNKFEKDELIPIFDDENILEKISSFLPLMIHQSDNLPHNICETCLQIIDSSFELIVKAQCSEQYFFKLVNNFNKVLDDNPRTLCLEEDTPKRKRPVALDLYKQFGCDICGEQLKKAVELDEHIQEVHGNQSAAPPNTTISVNTICSLCGQLFDSEESYVLHKCDHVNKCSLCKKLFKTKCLLNRHVQNMCKTLYYCQHCYRSYHTKSSLVKHMQTNHLVASVKGDCAACNKKPDEAGYFEHTCMEAVSSTKGSNSIKYRCYICGQGYKRQINLARHCMQHEPKSTWKFECQKCGEMFEKERLLHVHYEKVHKMPKTWICRFCGKNLATKLSMQIHERIHTQVKPYVCEWCGNAFRSKANLIQHHAKHTGVKRHKCPVCGKMFSRTFFLKTHLRVHTGEKPFQCDVCEQRFTQVGDMRRHRRRHDEPPRSARPAVFIVRRPLNNHFPAEENKTEPEKK